MASKSNVLTIAEVGQAHDGSIGIAHSFIDALKNSGIDIIKFQTHIADAESSANEPFRINFSYEDKTRFEYWKRMEFTYGQWKELKQHCDDFNIEFMSTPSSIAAINLLEDLKVKRYKVGSGDISNKLLLKRLAQTKKPIILSSGMSNIEELQAAIEQFSKTKNYISLLQCTSMYPTKPENIGLNLMIKYRDLFGCQVGYSDHSGDIYACLAATAMGAELLEFHVTFDREMFGPDSKSSITIKQVPELIRGINYTRKIINNPCTDHLSEEIFELKSIFEKTLALNKNLLKGSIITFEDLESKKPSNMGINVNDYKEVIGKKLLNSKNKNDFLQYEDIYPIK